MKMMLSTIFLLLVSIPIVSAAEQSVDNAQAVLDALLQEQRTLLKQREKILENRIKQEIKALELQHQSHKLELEREVWMSRLLFVALGFLVGIAGAFSASARYAGKQAIKRIDRIIHEDYTHLERILDNSRYESKIKREDKLLIVTGEQDSQLASDFRVAGFNPLHMSTRSLGEVFDSQTGRVLIDESEFSLIVLDTLAEDDLIAFLDAGNAASYVAFKEGRYNPAKLPGANKLVLANSHITLYPRTMELLTYRLFQRQRPSI